MGCDIFILLIRQQCITVALDPFLEGTAQRCLTGRPHKRRRGKKLDRPSRNYTSTGWKASRNFSEVGARGIGGGRRRKKKGAVPREQKWR